MSEAPRRTRPAESLPAGSPPAHERRPRPGGRPTLDAARKRDAELLEAATALFLAQGYGATTLEMVVRSARVSKRTLYQRYPDKAALFQAVVEAIIAELHPPAGTPLIQGASLEAILERLAGFMVHACVLPRTLALYRLVVGESARFPELARALHENSGTREAIALVSRLLLGRHAPDPPALAQAEFAAQQFLHLVTSVPQRRAMGFGSPMSEAERAQWARDSVQLFLRGCPRPA